MASAPSAVHHENTRGFALADGMLPQSCAWSWFPTRKVVCRARMQFPVVPQPITERQQSQLIENSVYTKVQANHLITVISAEPLDNLIKTDTPVFSILQITILMFKKKNLSSYSNW